MPYQDTSARKLYLRNYQRRWIAERRKAYFAGKSCVDCGATTRLELDHVDRATKVHHGVWSWSAVRREAEIAKCVPRCHDCHQAKTNRENAEIKTVPFSHGTAMAYRKGCRCEECNEARVLYRKGTISSRQHPPTQQPVQPKLPIPFTLAGDKFVNGWLARRQREVPAEKRRFTAAALGHATKPSPAHEPKTKPLQSLPLSHEEAA